MTRLGSEAASAWGLDPEVVFLNHGSFGACPTEVLAAQAEWRARMEREPVRFLDRELWGALEQARGALGAFLGVEAETLAFVPNTTYGVNAVLRSFPLERGDQVVVTQHEYRATRNAVDFVAARAGAEVVEVAVPFPGYTAEAVVEGVRAALTERTALVVLDHVTSATGVVQPVEAVVEVARARGVPVLVDGAHAPGMLELDVGAVGADYYVGNCHKWMCAPKGSAFLRVAPGAQGGVRPLAISHGASMDLGGRSRFRLEFEWTGTDDPTPYLCVPTAIEVMGRLGGGWSALRAANHGLVCEARAHLLEVLGAEAPCAEEDLGTLATIPLPEAPFPEGALWDPLQEALFGRFGVEVPVMRWPAPPARWVRISAQLYNAMPQYRLLGEALRELVAA